MQDHRLNNRFPKPISTAEILAACKRQSLVPAAHEDVRHILQRRFKMTALRDVSVLMLTVAAALVLYYPIVRGYFWLVLAIGYWCGFDSWPGPYTPFPSDMFFGGKV